MPLNLSDGDFLPFLQYDAKAGRWFAKAEGAAERVEIEKPTLVFDMPNIKTGWIRFPAEGGPPEHVWDGSPTDPRQKAPRPMGEGWKRGFEVLTYSNAIIPGSQSKLGMRSFSSNAFGVISVISGMYSEYEAKVADNPGKLPIFVCKNVRGFSMNVRTEAGMQQITIYEPVFELAGWVDVARVPEFEVYRNGRVQFLPPTQQPRRLAATAPNGGYPQAPLPSQQPQRQHVTQERQGYTLSTTQRIAQEQNDDPLSQEIPW